MKPRALEGPSEVVIIGGGFGGLAAARALRRAPVHVTLVDRRNHHLFQPLLYQVATAALTPSEIAAPLRRILRRQLNTRVMLAEVVRIDVEGRRVLLDDGDQLPYDQLIVAPGSSHAYFGHDEFEPFAPGLKNLEDAVEIRRRVLMAYERADRERDPVRRAEWLTFVVVGGGPTGVELAGALAEIARDSLHGEFTSFDPRNARILLVEGLDRVLATYPPELSQKAEAQLEQLGARVRPHAMVTRVDERGVWIGDERIGTRTVLWAAGVAASSLGRTLGAPLDRAGRVKVAPDLSLPDHPEVFVVGDLAAVDSDGKQVPGVAPAAIQEGRHAAANLLRRLRHEPTRPFRYHDKGSLATIGRASGVADFGRIHLSGLLAWLAWLVIHIVFLIGFRNRVVVLFDWAWAYLTRQRNARIITNTWDEAELHFSRRDEVARHAEAREQALHGASDGEPLHS